MLIGGSTRGRVIVSQGLKWHNSLELVKDHCMCCINLTLFILLMVIQWILHSLGEQWLLRFALLHISVI
jgi:hypothetical protein